VVLGTEKDQTDLPGAAMIMLVQRLVGALEDILAMVDYVAIHGASISDDSSSLLSLGGEASGPRETPADASTSTSERKMTPTLDQCCEAILNWAATVNVLVSKAQSFQQNTKKSRRPAIAAALYKDVALQLSEAVEPLCRNRLSYDDQTQLLTIWRCRSSKSWELVLDKQGQSIMGIVAAKITCADDSSSQKFAVCMSQRKPVSHFTILSVNEQAVDPTASSAVEMIRRLSQQTPAAQNVPRPPQWFLWLKLRQELPQLSEAAQSHISGSASSLAPPDSSSQPLAEHVAAASPPGPGERHEPGRTVDKLPASCIASATSVISDKTLGGIRLLIESSNDIIVERPSLETPFGLQLMSKKGAEGLYLSKVHHHCYPEVLNALLPKEDALEKLPGRHVALINGLRVTSIAELQKVVREQLRIRLLLR
jgi:hypothetical protein